MRLKPSLSTLLALLILLTAIAPTGMAQEPNAPREKVTIARASNSNTEDLDTNLYTLLYEDAFNIDFEFIVYPSADAQTKFSVLASSGAELPDILNIGLDEVSILNYGSRGVLLELDDYWANPEMTPNFLEYVEPQDQDFMRKNMKSADGHIYYQPSYSPVFWNEMSYRAWINQAWLDTLGLEIPTTPAEFKDVLTAFVTQDPNRNGRQDEYGLVSSTGSYGMSVFVFFMNAFIETNPDYRYFYLEDGVITPAFTKDAFKDGLQYMNDLFNAGLLSPLSFTQDDTQLKSLINQEGDYTIGCVTAGSISNWTDAYNNPRYLSMTLLEPLKGPNGVQISPRTAAGLGRGWFITSGSKNPELCFRMGDYGYSFFMSITGRRGEYGVDWTDDPTLLAQYENVSPDLSVNFVVLNETWNVVQNKHWGNGGVSYFSRSNGSERSRIDAAVPIPQKAHAMRYAPYQPGNVIGPLLYTAEETDELAIIRTAIDEYVAESIVALITGNMTFEDWPRFQAELSGMGLERYTAIQQAAYDRKAMQ